MSSMCFPNMDINFELWMWNLMKITFFVMFDNFCRKFILNSESSMMNNFSADEGWTVPLRSWLSRHVEEDWRGILRQKSPHVEKEEENKPQERILQIQAGAASKSGSWSTKVVIDAAEKLPFEIGWIWTVVSKRPTCGSQLCRSFYIRSV